MVVAYGSDIERKDDVLEKLVKDNGGKSAVFNLKDTTIL